MPDDKKYRLGRGYLSGLRLNLQHYCWKNTLGYNLHPSIPLDRPDLKIADVGTGTGLFPIDLALSLPKSTQLDGFDISRDQFVIPEYLPSNVSLLEQDAFEEPPQHLQGQYDVVHLRLFMSSVFQGQPEPLVNHASKLLKPGGYLQWDEFSPDDFQVISQNQSSIESLQKFLDLSVDMMKNDRPMDWIVKLPHYFEKGGFDVVAKEAPREPLWQRRMNTEGFCALAEEFAANFWDKNGSAGNSDDRQMMSVKMNDEVSQGSSISQAFRVVVGRKKLE